MKRAVFGLALVGGIIGAGLFPYLVRAGVNTYRIIQGGGGWTAVATSDLNMSDNDIDNVLSITSASAAPASTGVLRLGNTETLCWEIATPGTDECLTLDASNNFKFDNPVAFGNDPADAGLIRLSNAQAIGWEVAPADNDVTLTVSSNELVVFANNTGLSTQGVLSLGSMQVETVNAATTFALTASLVELRCTGAESINTITNGISGSLVYLMHWDSECTLVDDDDPTASNAINLTGAATNDTGAADKTITLVHDGTHWLQLDESAN